MRGRRFADGATTRASGRSARTLDRRQVLAGLGAVGAGMAVSRAVLEAHQVAGRGLCGARGRRPAEAELEPPHRHDPPAQPGEVARRVEGNLRIIRAGLHTEVPSAPVRVELIAGQRGQGRERSRAPCPQPEAPVKEPGPETDGQGERGRRQAGSFSGVRWRRVRLPGAAGHRLARCHRRGRGRPVSEEGDEIGATGPLADVERREGQPILRGGGDACLVLPTERNHRAARIRRTSPITRRAGTPADHTAHAAHDHPGCRCPRRPGLPGRPRCRLRRPRALRAASAGSPVGARHRTRFRNQQ